MDERHVQGEVNVLYVYTTAWNRIVFELDDDYREVVHQ